MKQKMSAIMLLLRKILLFRVRVYYSDFFMSYIVYVIIAHNGSPFMNNIVKAFMVTIIILFNVEKLVSRRCCFLFVLVICFLFCGFQFTHP